MKAIWDFIRKKNMLFKLIVSYVLVGFLFIGGFSYAVLSKVSENMTAEINETSESMINQTYNTADILLTSTFTFYSQLFINNETIKNALNGTDFNRYDIYRINRELNNYAQSNPLVSSIYVYNNTSGLVFTTDMTFSTIDNFYDKDMTSLLLRGEFYKHGIFIPREVQFSFAGSNKATESQKLISIVFGNLRPDGKWDGMIVNIDQKVFQGLVTKGSREATYKVIIVNNEGKIITGPDGMVLDGDKANPDFLQTVLAAQDKRGKMLSSIDGTNYMISYVKSDRLGWTFISVANYEKLLSKVNTLKSFILWITVICFSLMAATSVFFTRSIYVPIYQLITRMRNTAVEPKEQLTLNEYDLLNKSFSSLENKVNTLQTDVNQSLSSRKQDFLRSLINGTIGKGTDFRKTMEKLGIGFEEGRFLVCMLKIDAFHELSEKYDMVDVSLLKYAIENISRELASVQYRMETLEDGHDSLDLILNIRDGGEADKSSVESLLKDIQINVKKFLKITVSASVGPIVDRIEQVKHSRQGAYQAAHYRLIYGRNSLISYTDITAAEMVEYQYPAGLEKQIMDSLKAGDLERLQELSAEFIDAIHPFSYDEMILALLQMLVMTIRTSKDMASFDSEDAYLEIHTCQQQLLRFDTLEQIEAWYFSLCTRIVAIRDKQSQNRNKKVVETIIAYIQENYTDSNLTVEMMAQMVGLTVNYFRRQFKEETGESVSGYIAELRFKKAEELLLLTDHPVNKIGELVGFDNTRYFSTLFKKRFGKTPDHYRKEHKLNSMMQERGKQ